MLMIVILRECLSQRKCGDDKETIKQNQYQKTFLTRVNKDIRDFTRSGGGSSAAVGGESGQHPDLQTEGSPN